MAKPDFMTDYQRGNAYVWGRISGESQTLRSGIYDMTVDYNIKELQEKLLMLYSEYDSLYSDN